MKKKGVSIIIGYVLLVVFAIIIGTIVYQTIKTYVPKDVPECPESVSIFIKDIIYTEDSLNITIMNNGLFDIAGYFIRATNSSSQEIATKDLSQFLENSLGDATIIVNNAVLFVGEDNPLKSNGKQTQIFNLDEEIFSIEIIPVRFQEEDNKRKFISCGSSKVREKTILKCVPTCGARECGPDPVCGTECGPCIGTDVCTGIGECVPPAECTDTCSNLGYECGSPTICGTTTNCGSCLLSETCNATLQCEITCGNGVIDSGEGCDDENIIDGDGCNSTCQIELGWDCTGEPSECFACNNNYICDANENCQCSDCFNKQNGCDIGFTCQGGTCFPAIAIQSCKSYCFDQNEGYNPILSGCVNNCGGSCNGTCEPGGNQYCSSPTTECCCVPY